MIDKVIIISSLILSLHAFSSEMLMPSWVYQPNEGEASYCVDVSESKENDRFTASHYAALELSESNRATTVIGNEVINTNQTRQVTTSQYEMEMVSMSKGDQIEVDIIEEAFVKNQLCVLVTERNGN